MIVDENSNLYAFGRASQGRLGLGNSHRNQWTPARVSLRERKRRARSRDADYPDKSGSGATFAPRNARVGGDSRHTGSRKGLGKHSIGDVSFVACGVACTVIVSFDEVWQTGCLRTQAHTNHFRFLEELEGCAYKQVACGSMHALALSNSGHVFSWGQGSMLGHGDEVERDMPELILGLVGHKITSISCGDFNSIAVTDDGDVFYWGQCDWNQRGVSSPSARIVMMPTPLYLDDGSSKRRGASKTDDDGDVKRAHASGDDDEEDEIVVAMKDDDDLGIGPRKHFEDESEKSFVDIAVCGGSTLLLRIRKQGSLD